MDQFPMKVFSSSVCAGPDSLANTFILASFSCLVPGRRTLKQSPGMVNTFHLFPRTRNNRVKPNQPYKSKENKFKTTLTHSCWIKK